MTETRQLAASPVVTDREPSTSKLSIMLGIRKNPAFAAGREVGRKR
jgi:hypothetical protein